MSLCLHIIQHIAIVVVSGQNQLVHLFGIKLACPTPYQVYPLVLLGSVEQAGLVFANEIAFSTTFFFTDLNLFVTVSSIRTAYIFEPNSTNSNSTFRKFLSSILPRTCFFTLGRLCCLQSTSRYSKCQNAWSSPSYDTYDSYDR